MRLRAARAGDIAGDTVIGGAGRARLLFPIRDRRHSDGHRQRGQTPNHQLRFRREHHSFRIPREPETAIPPCEGTIRLDLTALNLLCCRPSAETEGGRRRLSEQRSAKWTCLSDSLLRPPYPVHLTTVTRCRAPSVPRSSEMRIIDRYLLRQFVQTFLICFLSLVGLFIVFDLFTNLEEFVTCGKKAGGVMRVHRPLLHVPDDPVLRPHRAGCWRWFRPCSPSPGSNGTTR